MKFASLNDLYLQQLMDLYSAESQLIKALPKMAKAARNPDLRNAFSEHLEQTNHLELFGINQIESHAVVTNSAIINTKLEYPPGRRVARPGGSQLLEYWIASQHPAFSDVGGKHLPILTFEFESTAC